jgi:hypothetical protein
MGNSGTHRLDDQTVELDEKDLELVQESKDAVRNTNAVKSEGDDAEAVSGVHHSTLETHARINYQLRPLLLTPGELFDRTGLEILQDQLGCESPVMIRSGESQQVVNIMKFRGKPMISLSTPGLPGYQKNGRKNTTAFVLHSHPEQRHLSAVMFNGLNADLEDAALANAAAVTAAYDLSRSADLNLAQIFQHTNRMVCDQKEEMSLPQKHVAVLGACLEPENNSSSDYQLQILGAGDIHCIIINPEIRRCQSTPLQTVANRLQHFNVPMGKRKQILEEYSRRSQLPLDHLEQALLQSFGQEEFIPVESRLKARSGEILVLASGCFIRSFGGSEFFQDSNFSRIFLSEYFRNAKNLYKASQNVFNRITERQQKGTFPDRAFSLFAVEIP